MLRITFVAFLMCFFLFFGTTAYVQEKKKEEIEMKNAPKERIEWWKDPKFSSCFIITYRCF